jgi:hypothetical protein
MKKYDVLLEKMTPLYTQVRVAANNEEDASEQALEEVGDYPHDRLPSDETWSVIPPVDIFNPAEDGEPTVIEISELEGDVDDCGSSSVER